MKNKSPASSVEVMQRNAAKAETLLKLLANANRLMILCHLVKGPQSVGALAGLVGLSHSALSQHLARMRHLKIVQTHKEGQTVFYRICNPEVEAILATLYLMFCK